MAVVDTSFLIAFQNRLDTFHKEARAHSPLPHPMITPWEVWVEYADVLTRAFPAKEIQDLHEDLLSRGFILRRRMEVEDVAQLLPLAEATRTALAREGHRPLSIFDLIVCRTAQRLNDSILTFDRGIEHVVRHRFFPGARVH